MSLSADIIDAVLAKMVIVDATVTTHNALTDKFRNEDSIGQQEYPFFEGFGVSWEVAPGDLGQGITVITTQYVYLKKAQLAQVPGPGEQMWLDIEGLQTQLNTDPSLAGLVNRTLITVAAVDEVTDDDRTLGLLEVQSFVVFP